MKTGDRIATILPRWAVYDPDDGWSDYDTRDEAEAAFDSVVNCLTEDSSDGWHESADLTAMYELRPVRRLALVITATSDDDTEEGDWCRRAACDYTADGVVEDCAPLRIGAEVGLAYAHDRRGVVVDSHPERGWLVWWCWESVARWRQAAELWVRP